MTLHAQVVNDVGRAAWRLAPLIGPDLQSLVDERIRERAPMWAAILTGDDDDERAELVQDILVALWGDGDPPPGWWSTPLGRACAMSLGHDTSEAVSRSVAGAILGVHRGTIDRLVHRGRLERHPDGGLTRASVLAYLIGRRKSS